MPRVGGACRLAVVEVEVRGLELAEVTVPALDAGADPCPLRIFQKRMVVDLGERSFLHFSAVYVLLFYARQLACLDLETVGC